MDIREIIKKVNEILQAGEPGNVQEVKGAGGRIIHGYKPQFLLDALNEVYPHWSMEYKILNSIEGEKTSTYIVEVEVEIEGIKRRQIGQSTNVNEGDALKGAITDGMSKTLSLFSIGNRAYRGELKLSSGKPGKPPGKNSENPSKGRGISENQQKRLFAIAKSKGWDTDEIKELLSLLGLKGSADIKKDIYEKLIDYIEERKTNLPELIKLRAEQEGYKGGQLLNFLGDITEEDMELALRSQDVWEQIIEDYRNEMKKISPEMDF